MSLHKSQLPFDVHFHIIQCIDSDDLKSFYALAQTCQALCGPALGRLWHTQDSIVPFLLLLPSEYREFEYRHEWSCQRLSIRTENLTALRKDPSQLTRMVLYAKRIKILNGLISWKLRARSATIQFMVETLPGLLGMDNLFPNLTELVLLDNERSTNIFGIDPQNLSDHRRLFTLLAPSLQLVYVSVGNDQSIRYCAVDMVVEALRKCRQLRSLGVVSSTRLYHCTPQQPVVIDLRTFFKTPEALRELASFATQSTSLQHVSVTASWMIKACTDLVTTPFTVHVLGHFRSIRTLLLTLDDVDGTLDDVTSLGSPNTAFPELEYLKLGILSLTPAIWFFDSCASTRIEYIHIRFLMKLSLEDLAQFFSSLQQFRSKFSSVNELGIRVNTLTDYYPDGAEMVEESPPLFRSLITTLSRLFPHVHAFKLKLSPPYEDDDDTIFLHLHDLFVIGNAFPELEVLKVDIGPNMSPFQLVCCVTLQEIIAFAHQFPKLRELGMLNVDSEAFYRHVADKSAPVLSAESALRVLKVRRSWSPFNLTPEDLAAYLRRHLPRLRAVKRSQRSEYHSQRSEYHYWDIVDRLVSAE